MTDEFSQVYIPFASRLNSFFEKYDYIEKGKNKVEEDNHQLRKDNQMKAQKIDELERKIEVMKLAKSMQSPAGEVHDAKVKINRLVREVENCIALLNK